MNVNDPAVDDISQLTIREISDHITGLLTIPRSQRTKKKTLVEYIIAQADPSSVNRLRKAGEERRAERNRTRERVDVGKKRKRTDHQYMRRVVQKIEYEATEISHHAGNSHQPDISSDSFLQLPTSSQLKQCYRAFLNATSNNALASTICGICARNVNISDQKATYLDLNSLPNAHRLIPHHPHASHTLFDGKLLEPKGVKTEHGRFQIMTCNDCISSLNKVKDEPPQYSLANNMWIGEIPWELQRLTFPEQLLIALIYPRHPHVFPNTHLRMI